jgi:hypothetical protein
MVIQLRNLAPLILFLAAPVSPAEPESDVVDDGSRRCINVGRILKTRVMDDNNIVFMMRHDRMYLNQLRSSCIGLARNGAFTYRIPTRSLCELDWITVLMSGSIGNAMGNSCTLGRFRPVTLEDLAMRFAPLIQPPAEKEVEPPPIEEMAQENDDETGSEDEPGETP